MEYSRAERKVLYEGCELVFLDGNIDNVYYNEC